MLLACAIVKRQAAPATRPRCFPTRFINWPSRVYTRVWLSVGSLCLYCGGEAAQTSCQRSGMIVPVLRPSIATLFLINLVTSWQEFFLPLIFSRSSASATLTLGITQAAVNPQYQTVAWGNEAAMALIVIAPVFILAIIFQKQIIEGLMAGSLKV